MSYRCVLNLYLPSLLYTFPRIKASFNRQNFATNLCKLEFLPVGKNVQVSRWFRTTTSIWVVGGQVWRSEAWNKECHPPQRQAASRFYIKQWPFWGLERPVNKTLVQMLYHTLVKDPLSPSPMERGLPHCLYTAQLSFTLRIIHVAG